MLKRGDVVVYITNTTKLTDKFCEYGIVTKVNDCCIFCRYFSKKGIPTNHKNAKILANSLQNTSKATFSDNLIKINDVLDHKTIMGALTELGY